MRNFQDTFETRERSFISAFSICMTEPLPQQQHLFYAMEMFYEVDPRLLKFDSYV